MEAKQKNTVGLIWMICSIVWLLLTLSVVLSKIGVSLLIVWLILWVAGLFRKPKWTSIAAVVISIIAFIGLFILWKAIDSASEVPAGQFVEWLQNNYDEEKLSQVNEKELQEIISVEMERIILSKSSAEIKAEFNAATGNSTLEKISYIFFDTLQEAIDNKFPIYANSLEKPSWDEDLTENEWESEDEWIAEDEWIEENEWATEDKWTNEEISESDNNTEENSQDTNNEENDQEDIEAENVLSEENVEFTDEDIQEMEQIVELLE